MRILIVAMALAAPTSSPIFRFETDGFWLNLHHFLYVLGRAQAGMPDAKRSAVARAPADQAEGVKGLSESDRQVWADAVAFYANGLSKQDIVFDQPLIGVTHAMRVPPNATATALKVDAELRATLERAAPIYRRVWWPRHLKANNDRAIEFAALLADHGAAVRAYITKAYQERWPADGHPINFSGYANWAGAYSTAGDLIVISSLDQSVAGPLGLESMFHEAMHQWDQPMLGRLSRLAKEFQTPPPRPGITHALIWYTAAEAVRSVIPTHRGYAEAGGMWNQQGLASFKAGLDTYWKPYLDGKSTLDAALVGLLKS
jgi:hypothetical protein